MVAASPSLSRAWCFRASSAHPIEAESYCFLARAGKTKAEACGGAHATMHAVALIYNRVVSRGLREMLSVFPIGKKHRQYVRNAWFPDRTQICKFPPNRIEFNSSHEKLFVSIQKCPSLIRALRNERNMNRCCYYTYCCSVFGMCD